MISFRDVTRARALRGVSFDIRAGEYVAVLGPSGAGKTTLLRLIARLDRPDSGDVRVEAERVGMVFQTPALWPHLKVKHHLEGDGLLRLFGLEAFADRRPGELSGGEQQRLSLARAVAHRPQLLLLDEPYTGLDPLLRRELAELVERLHREMALTTIHVTHLMEAPVRRADRVMFLREGRIQQVGTLDELSRSGDPWVHEYLSG